MSLRASNSRASELERAELALESTRRHLETIQQDMRSKERELQEVQEKSSEVCRQLENSCAKVQELEVKVEDLKLQVRCELKKNEAIERDTEMIPKLKDEIGEKDKQIILLQRLIEEKSSLLNASRKSAKERKERLEELENKDKETKSLREELDLAKNEVNTLKRLMWGKDFLAQQKCQILDQAKAVVDTLRVSSSQDERARLKHIQRALDQLKRIHVQAVFTGDSERAQETTQLGKVSKFPSGSIAMGEVDKNHPADNYSRPPFLFKTSCTQTSTSSQTANCPHDTNGMADGLATKSIRRQLRSTSSLSSGQIDTILCGIIHNGDRVSATVEQTKPRYGRKILSPVTYTGIVKFKGLMDKSNNDPRVYVGVRLDAPIGDSDGTHQGIRYMFVPPGHAKFFKIQDLDSVLDISNRYGLSSSSQVFAENVDKQHADYQHQVWFVYSNIKVDSLPSRDVPRIKIQGSCIANLTIHYH